MGIYIKGMEMPKDCYECDDSFLLIAIGCKCCKWFPNERPSECPLNEVSEPHGRLIDMDKVLEVIALEYGYDGIEDDMEYKVPTVIESEVEE